MSTNRHHLIDQFADAQRELLRHQREEAGLVKRLMAIKDNIRTVQARKDDIMQEIEDRIADHFYNS